MKTATSIFIAVLISAIFALIIFLIKYGIAGVDLTAVTENEVVLLVWGWDANPILTLPEGISRAWGLLLIFFPNLLFFRGLQLIFSSEKKVKWMVAFISMVAGGVSWIIPYACFYAIKEGMMGSEINVLILLIFLPMMGIASGFTIPFIKKGNILFPAIFVVLGIMLVAFPLLQKAIMFPEWEDLSMVSAMTISLFGVFFTSAFLIACIVRLIGGVPSADTVKKIATDETEPC